jgi:predicted GIY-YIG superfamily endonuclease
MIYCSRESGAMTTTGVMQYHVYILASRRYGTLYIGITNDRANRLS